MEEPSKVPCSMCGAAILLGTARKNDGVCMRCLPRFQAKTLQLDSAAQQLMDEFWTALEECGWLGELAPEQVENLRLDAISSFHGSDEEPVDPLLLLVSGYIVDESIESEGDYVSLLKELQRASGDVFSPEDPHDKFDEEAGEATISFRWCGHSYETTVPFENDDFHPDVIEFINEVLAENGVEKRFLPIFFEENPGVSIVFVSQQTYDKAVRIGLIPDYGGAA